MNPRELWRCVRIPVLALLTSTAIGCGSDTTAPTPPNPQNLFWRLSLNHRGVVMSTEAPYNTLQLVATAINADGDTIVTDAPVTYTTNDGAVRVSETGLLSALAVRTNVWVRATQSIDGVTLRDSVLVNITNVTNPSVFTTFSMAPTAIDGMLSTDCSVNDLLGLRKRRLTPRVWNASNQPIDGANVVYRVADPGIAAIARSATNVATITSYACRKETTPVMLYAEATIYGVRKQDSLLLLVQPPAVAIVNIRQSTLQHGVAPRSVFDPEEMTIGVGGVVIWFNGSRQPTDVVFDNPTAAEATVTTTPTVWVTVRQVPATGESGNIGEIPPDTGINGTISVPSAVAFVRARRFQTPGVYRYHSVLYGTTGTVVVKDTVFDRRSTP